MTTEPIHTLAESLGHSGFRFEESDATREHIALILLAMATEDGDLDDEELFVVREVLADTQVFADSAEIQRCMNIAFDILRSEYEFAERLRRALSVIAGDPVAAEVMAAMLATMVYADGVETLYETDFLEMLVEHLEVPHARVDEIGRTVVASYLAGLRRE